MQVGWVSGEKDGERRYHVSMPVRWRDLDAYNHVNNATMLTLLEEARTIAFWKVHPDDPSPQRPMAVVDAQANSATNTLISRQEAEYKVPIPYGHEPLDIQIWLSEIAAASVEVSYEVWNPVNSPKRILHTLARTTIVFVDTATGRPRRVSESERAAWQPFLGAPSRMRVDRQRRD
ncbi:acyl-CoA thioesterase [Gulosibacter chungangensis]|uniref:Acyl-CoA thioesterase n=2 Tax=Gulosibacter chungangensis TaxID=979746 RepID=A0A7J5BAD1_9MICO|nr:thioesterase family protein [Gulosibacter chungangensis]KAB1642727.1 acyl-CoA thioesterase [Gulosibacter chungangensis]